MLACVLGALSMLVLAFVTSVAGLIAGGCLLGACMGMFMTTTLAMSSDLTPPGMGGTSMSLSNFSMGGAQAVSPGIAGVIIYLTQSYSWSGLGYRPIFILSVVYFVVSIALMAKVKERVAAPTPR